MIINIKTFACAVAGAISVGIATCGCQTRITATKNAENLQPIYGVKDGVAYVAGYERASGGWEATARSPLWADESLKGLNIGVQTNGTVSLSLDQYDRNFSTNAVAVTEILVKGAVELTEKVAAAVVTAGGSTAAGAATSAIQSLVAKYIAAGGSTSNAQITTSNGSVSITDGNITCTDGSCYPTSK